jgi:arginase
VLEAIGVTEKLICADRNAVWTITISPVEGSDTIAVVSDCACACRTASAVCAAMAAGDFPVVIGGEHSCAIGTWRGVAQAITGKPLGILWIDVHPRSHTPETSHSGALDGMPLACLLDVGRKELTGGTQLPLPHQIAVIGARSFEADEVALLRGSGLHVFFMDEIARRRRDAVMQEALTLVFTLIFQNEVILNCHSAIDSTAARMWLGCFMSKPIACKDGLIHRRVDGNGTQRGSRTGGR